MNFKTIVRLAEIMSEHGLTGLEVKEKDTEIRLSRAPGAPPAATPAPAPAPKPAATAPTPPAEPAAPVTRFITAPMPGTFYTSSAADAPAYIAEGDVVKPDTVVCIVEAMKVMNEVKAETAGIVTRILAVNGQAVEYGQKLFEITPDAPA